MLPFWLSFTASLNSPNFSFMGLRISSMDSRLLVLNISLFSAERALKASFIRSMYPSLSFSSSPFDSRRLSRAAFSPVRAVILSVSTSSSSSYFLTKDSLSRAAFPCWRNSRTAAMRTTAAIMMKYAYSGIGQRFLKDVHIL